MFHSPTFNTRGIRQFHLIQLNLVTALTAMSITFFSFIGGGVGVCNNSGTVHELARSALKLVLLDSHKTYHI